MSRIISKQFFSLALSHWKSVVVHRYNIEDALCLGHAAMRKTKVDMARRLYSRARRARLSGAILKWKTETDKDRNMEEHTNAVAAMSNWAARIAGGRILKERFQQWLAFTHKSILRRNHKYSVMNGILLRFLKTNLQMAFQQWKYVTNEYIIDRIIHSSKNNSKLIKL